MGWRGFLACCLISVTAFSAIVSARFIVEEHSLTISASSLKGTFTSAIANFGIPQYGGTMAGTLVYPTGDKAQACSRALEGMSLKAAALGELPKILLVDRGGCYFTEKVWNAQKAGASAVLVADDKDENLITMDAPDDDPETDSYIGNITIPSALIRKNTSDAIKQALSKGELVYVNMDWTEALPHPDERVEYEFWTNSNDECGEKCDAQSSFVEDFKGLAQTMEKGGYVQFTPHYITWYCPKNYVDSKQCKSQCIHNGRYCAPDPEQDFDVGYDGKDVVVENLRELCVFKVCNESMKPWVWWDYVTDFKLRCKMKDKNYNQECAEKIITSLGLDMRRITDCVGDPKSDVESPILKAEQAAQVGNDQRSDVTILPTVVINQKQYRGKLDSKAILRALCAGFKETTEPPQCLGKDIETNECLSDNNGGCWKQGNYTACKDTFRGRVCQCPKDQTTGTVFVGDGYTSCTAAGPGRCLVNNGGCWSATNDGITYTACQESLAGTGCACPAGFQGDGFKCDDVNECAASSPICKCPACQCKNTFGSYECSCSGNGVYIREHDTCVGSTSAPTSSGTVGWLMFLILAALAAVCVGGYIVYKYRIRSYMDSEIRAIMAQYMPLDSQGEAGQHRNAQEEA